MCYKQLLTIDVHGVAHVVAIAHAVTMYYQYTRAGKDVIGDR
jgi:hypothetical protein